MSKNLPWIKGPAATSLDGDGCGFTGQGPASFPLLELAAGLGPCQFSTLPIRENRRGSEGKCGFSPLRTCSGKPIEDC